MDAHEIGALLRPQTVAIVGASEKSIWSRRTFERLMTCEPRLRIHLVNPKGGIIHGREAATSCAMLGQRLDIGILLVPVAAIEAALDDLSRAGASFAVILGAGFAETGIDGARLQQRILDKAGALGIRLLGPNSLGFVNFLDDIWLWSGTMEPPSEPGSIALVSQSGGILGILCSLAQQHEIGLSHLVSTGNEADVDASIVAEYLVDEPRVRVVGVLAETIRDPLRFERAARKAIAAGKPIVIHKIGQSEAAARSALSHTGALVGDDAIFQGLCDQFGLVRVHSLEDLLFTAAVMAHIGPVSDKGAGFVSISGGICGIVADRAEAENLPLAPLTDSLDKAFRDVLPDFGTPNNPLDITGAGVLQPDLYTKAIAIAGQSGAFSLIGCAYDVPTREGEVTEVAVATLEAIAEGIRQSAVPILCFSHALRAITPAARGVLRKLDLPYLGCGVHHGMTGIAHAWKWSQRRDEVRQAGPSVAVAPTDDWRPGSELATLSYLHRYGVPVVPMTLATSCSDAVEDAKTLGWPVVLKLASPDIPHKSDIGGVELGLTDTGAVASAYERLVDRTPYGARLDGIIVAPMRPKGVELVIGVRRDPQWGLVLAVGMGGIWVEILKDVALRKLPVTKQEVLVMLGGLKAQRLLQGARGVPAADLDVVAGTIVAIAGAAAALGDPLDTLEVNPLWVHGSTIEALDALCVWRPEVEDIPDR